MRISVVWHRSAISGCTLVFRQSVPAELKRVVVALARLRNDERSGRICGNGVNGCLNLCRER